MSLPAKGGMPPLNFPPRDYAVAVMKKNIRGQSLVEFSLCFVVFIMVVFAIIDFGRYFLLQHNLNLIAAEAARVGITGKRLDRNIGAGTVTLNRDQSIRVKAIETANQLGLVDLGSVNPYSPRNITVEHVSGEAANSTQNINTLTWAPGPGGYDAMVRVTVRQQFRYLTPFMNWLGANSTLTELSASSVQRNRGDEDEFAFD